MSKQKVVKILAPAVPLVLEVEGGFKLELKLAWTMRAVMLMETTLRRQYGIFLNLLQKPGSVWQDMNCTVLAVAVWALAQQDHADQYGSLDDLDIIASYLTPDNLTLASKTTQEAYIEALPAERQKQIRELEAVVAAETAKKAAEGKKEEDEQDPTPAPSPA